MLAGVFFLSGAAGLIHEIVWTRMFARVFGTTSLAVSTVLAAYMGGLALGSWGLGGRLLRIADRMRVYALLEIAIGVSALLVPLALRAVEPVYGMLWRGFRLEFGAFTALRFMLAAGILLVPTVLMGATLPVLADHLARLQGRRLAPAWLYTVNLAGAVLGVAAGGFLLLPALGLRATIAIAVAVNLAAGVAVLWLPRPVERPRPPIAPQAAERERTPLLLFGAALASGLISLATQVVWVRVLVLIVGSTSYAFSAVLVVYLMALAAGGAWASRRATRVGDVVPDLAIVHALLGLFTLAAVSAVDLLPGWYASLFQGWAPRSVADTVALNMVVVFALLFPSVLCAGTVLPLALAGAVAGEDCALGGVVGRIYAVNTVGAVAGALLAGFVLLPGLGSQRMLLCVAVMAGLLGFLFALVSSRRRILAPVTAVIGVLLLAGSLLQRPWEMAALQAGVYEPRAGSQGQIVHPAEHVIFHREGRNATVAVTQRKQTRSLRINGRVNASDNALDIQTQVLLAQLPLLIAPRIDDVFVLGWGSGITVGTALQAPVKRVTAVELEPAVIDASDLFRHVNHDPRQDPRLQLYLDDARHLLRAAADSYDVIISEPSHPWIAGVADLFTQDFFALAARRLREDGLFAQWLQGYQISVETFRSILLTFASVFPEVIVYAPPHRGDWILLGSRVPLRIDLEALERRSAHAAVQAESARIGLRRPEHLLAGIHLSPERVREITRGARPNTDDNMYVEFHAPADVHLQQGARLIATVVGRFPTAVESMLTQPAVLLRDPDRLAALIEGLEWHGRDATAYRKLRADLR